MRTIIGAERQVASCRNRTGQTARIREFFATCTSIFFLTCGQALAQEVIGETERLDSDRPEAWATNYFTSVSLLSGLSVPHSREPGSVEVGIELGSVPKLNQEQRRVGFNGIKEENLNQADLFGRPRITIGLPGRTALTLSYVPPIRIFGLKPNLFAFALERPLYEADPWTVGVRLYGQVGNVKGPFTCSGDVARFSPGSAENPYGCEEKSADRATQRFAGLELSGAYRIERLRGLTPYVTVAGNFLDTKVQVRARTFGILDRSRLVSDTWTFSAGAGVVYPLARGLTLSAGMFYSPLSVIRPPATSRQNDALLNVRALLAYRLL